MNAMLARIGRLLTPARAFERQDAPSPVREGDPFPDPPHVLVVDDDHANRFLLTSMLCHWSIAPLQAADGAEAVALACGQHFDLILMDLQMPILDGLAATAQIRDFERWNDHPRAVIVAHSSSILGDDWPTLRARGFDESLHKPCSRQSLELCLKRWCGGRSPQVSSRTAAG